MRPIQLRKQCGLQSGQSLLETALLVPLLLLIVLNAINFGYYFIVCIQLASAPREGVEYSIQGSLSAGSNALPKTGPFTATTTVSYLTYQDMLSLNGSSSTPVQVCSKVNGVTSPADPTQTVSKCITYPTAGLTFPAPAPDPEAPNFVLNRVDVRYTVKPLIPATPFGITLIPSLTFSRHVCMRSIGG